MHIKNSTLVVLLFTGLFLTLSACQRSAIEEAAVTVTVAKTAVYTPTPEPTATPTTKPTLPPANTVAPEPTPTNPPAPTATTATDTTSIPQFTPNDDVTFNSTFMETDAGIKISFDHPRAWQTGYFADSGVAGWVISDADPNETFWDTFRTGDEILLVIMPSDKSNIAAFPENSEPVDLILDDNITARYALMDGKIHGNIIHDERDTTLALFGDYPPEKEAQVQAGLETILTTFSWEDVDDPSGTTRVGVREEGKIRHGEAVTGYTPFASMSAWEFTGTKNQKINLSIHSYEPDITLLIGILDENNSLTLLDEVIDFTDSITLESLTIPEDGTYAIMVVASTGFFKMGPWSPPSEESSYGWYDISITDATGTGTAAETTSQSSPTANPTRTDDTLNPDWLITADDLNTFSDEIEIVEWEAAGDDVLWNTRVCRNHLGWSWSANQNLAINCVLSVASGASFKSVIDSLYEQEIIRSEAITLEPYHQYDDEMIIFGDRLNNGHTFYDLFLMRGDLLYWNSISVGTPPGFTPEMIFEEDGEGIETFLYDLTLINIERVGE